MARDAAGDAVVAWLRAGKGPIGESFVIEATARAAGGAWQQPTVIASGMVRVPVVAMTPSGEAVIVWPSTRFPRRNGFADTRASVNVRTLATHSSSEWSAKHVLAAHIDPGGYRAADPQIAVNAGGEVSVAFRIAAAGARDQSSQEVLLSRRAAHATWKPPVKVARVNDGGWELQMGLAATGKAVIAWNTGGPKGEYEGSPKWIEAVTVAANGRPIGRPQVLSPRRERAIELQLVTDANGESALTFRMGGKRPGLPILEGASEGCDVEQIFDEGGIVPLPEGHGYGEGEGPQRVTRTEDDGRFGEPVTLTDHSWGASIAISPRGDAAVLFEHATSKTHTLLEASFSLTGGGWSAAAATPLNSVLAGLGFDEAGDLKTLFAVHDGFEIATHTSGTWDHPEALSMPAKSGQDTAVVTTTGSMTLGWLTTTGNHQVINVRSSG